MQLFSTPRVVFASGFLDIGLPCRVAAAAVLLQNQPDLNVLLPGTVRRDLSGWKVERFKFEAMQLFSICRKAYHYAMDSAWCHG